MVRGVLPYHRPLVMDRTRPTGDVPDDHLPGPAHPDDLLEPVAVEVADRRLAERCRGRVGGLREPRYDAPVRLERPQAVAVEGEEPPAVAVLEAEDELLRAVAVDVGDGDGAGPVSLRDASEVAERERPARRHAPARAVEHADEVDGVVREPEVRVLPLVRRHDDLGDAV